MYNVDPNFLDFVKHYDSFLVRKYCKPIVENTIPNDYHKTVLREIVEQFFKWKDEKPSGILFENILNNVILQFHKLNVFSTSKQNAISYVPISSDDSRLLKHAKFTISYSKNQFDGLSFLDYVYNKNESEVLAMSDFFKTDLNDGVYFIILAAKYKLNLIIRLEDIYLQMKWDFSISEPIYKAYRVVRQGRKYNEKYKTLIAIKGVRKSMSESRICEILNVPYKSWNKWKSENVDKIQKIEQEITKENKKEALKILEEIGE